MSKTSEWTNFERFVRRWQLVPDGDPIITPYSQLLPVRTGQVPAMLKVALSSEERFGANLMEWWGGEGAAGVLAREGDALLMERAGGGRSLARMSAAGADDEAMRIICEVATRLHRPRPAPLPHLVGLERWFEALWPAAARCGSLFEAGAATARRLLADHRETVVLHGDLHHDNVLDFGERGWLVIDPKGLLGERTFDFVNLLRNPFPAVALAPGRFEHRVDLISNSAGLDRKRLLEWTLAFACLSATWILVDGDEPELDMAVARKAAALLGVES